MKENIVSFSLTVITLISVAACCFLPLKIVVMAIAGGILACAFFGGLFALLLWGAKKQAALDPETRARLDEFYLQMDSEMGYNNPYAF